MPPARDHIKYGKFADTLVWLPQVPKPWRRAIRKMLHDEKSLRYASATQVLNALSKLDTLPWITSITPGLVRWEQLVGKRRRLVEWIEHSQHKHEWRAWSEPLGKVGRPMTLDGSGGVVSRSKAVQGLEAFFNV